MDKAYDPKELVRRLRDHGLEIGEDAARAIFTETFQWVKDSAVISENTIDNMIIGLVAPLESYVLAQIDRIDGEQEPPEPNAT